MIKRLSLLNGLAILGVVCSHSVGWGYMAMFWWADRYRPVTAPNYDQFGTVLYHILTAVKKLAVFSVPAFLFISGFFMAYAARGSQAARVWKMVRVRIVNLLVPYLIWSGVIFVSEVVEGITYTPGEYLKRLALGGAHPAYYYVPLLCQFYLLSPLLVPFAETKERLLLFVSALIQLAGMTLRYLDTFQVAVIGLDHLLIVAEPWSFVNSPFFFALGMVSCFHLQEFKRWLLRFRWHFLVAAAVLGLVAILESNFIYESTGRDLRGAPGTIFSNLYAISLVLCFMAFPKIPLPFPKLVHRLGRGSYGIYLVHSKLLEFGARFLQRFLPWILAYQILFQPTLIVFAVGGALLFMAAVARSPARKVYRYLFG